MIIKAIAQICKKGKVIQIYEGNNIQYIGDGSSIYPLYKMPRITTKTIFTIFDIVEKKEKDFACSVVDIPKNLNLKDYDEKEVQIDASNINIGYHGHSLLPLKCSIGLVFIDVSYLKPVADKIDIEFYERETEDRTIYIALKAGLLLYGIVMPLKIITKEFVQDMKDLTQECEEALLNTRFKDETKM